MCLMRHKSIVIVSPKEINKIELSKCIEESCNSRKDGNYAIDFTLSDKTGICFHNNGW